MKRLLIIVLCALYSISSANITIRWAQSSDLDSIIALDRTVTYEYFKPLYRHYYDHLELGKNPDPFLEKELAEDEKEFTQLLNTKNNRMIIALENEHAVGLIFFHRQEKIIHLDLLLIDANYRQQGIGRKLTQAMFSIHADADKCIVYVIRGNDGARTFYEKLGFMNQGIPLHDKKNIYGIAYADMYWLYELKYLKIPGN